jgi:hypothetical protein
MTYTTASPSATSSDHHNIKIFGRVFSISDRTLLISIVFLALLLRLASAAYQGNQITDLPGIFDQISYDGLAQRVVGGSGFSFAQDHWPATRGGEPTAHWSYLYTLYLVTIYKVFGHLPVAARLIQALIAGIFHPLLIWRISTRLFNRTVGLIAAALTAIYIYFFYYAGGLITETFYIIGILWIFDVSLRIVADNQATHTAPHWKRWIELGVAIGITLLLRQVFLLFLPFLFFWLWWNVRIDEISQWKHRLHWSALIGLFVAGVVFVAMIIPFTLRNYRAFHTFVLLNTNAGYAFFWGNHPIYGTNFRPLLPASGPGSYYDLIPLELRSLDEAAMDKALLGRGIQFVLDDPIRIFWLSLTRAREFFKFWPSAGSGTLSNISRVGSFGITLPLTLFGIFLILKSELKTRDAYQRQGILLLLFFIVVYVGVHLISWALIRYRLPVDAILLIFAGLAIHKLTDKIFQPQAGSSYV